MENLDRYAIKSPWVILLVSLFTFLACSQPEQHSPDTSLKLAGTPDPRPKEPSNLEGQLQRYIGQTSFVNISSPPHGWLDIAQPENSASADDRVIEEADLFKIGDEGTGILYVLNRYRGLQVIDFSQGGDDGRIIARSDASGHEPLEMYYHEERQQIIIVERAYHDEYGQWLEQAQGHILVYSVSDPSKPQVLQSMRLNADIADSRRVGDVLYLTSSRWPNYYEGEASGRGFIDSYHFTSNGLRHIANLELNLPVRSRESLQVMTSQVGEQVKYYVTLTLTESYFGFADRQSSVELVDISDPAGKMQRILQVSAKGFITERSAVSIKDGTLLVVSNYWQDFEGQQIRRVAVEGFILPGSDSPKISSEEAKFRSLWLAREMKRLGIDLDTAIDLGLTRHPEFGLHDVYVLSTDGSLSKWLADAAAFSGDTTGLSAQIQDVRFVEDLLYVFWVPQNQVDPLDIFDISQPQESIRFLQRTYFDGWIERSIPIFYADRHFILGLGWIVTATGSSGGTERRAQMMMFEVIKNSNGGVRTQILEQLTLKDQNSWANWSEADKTITVKFAEGNARGSVLFPYFQWGESLQQGGKLVGFDLQRGLSGQAPFLSEGALLAAPLSWLRRVFSNPEIDRLHILTDLELASYEEPELGIGSPAEILRSVQILELARDLRAYGILQNEDDRFAVQIISRDSGWLLDTATTELRLSAWDDEENVRQTLSLPGRFISWQAAEDGLYVLTLQSKESADTGSYQESWTLYYAGFQEGTQLLTPQQTSWRRNGNPPTDLRPMSVMPHPGYQLDASLITHPSLGLLVISDGQIRRITEGEASIQPRLLEFAGCLADKAQALRYHIWGSQLAVSYQVPVVAPANMAVNLTRHYLLDLRINGEEISCGLSRNIPGRPVLVLDNKQLVVQEDRFIAWEAWNAIHEETQASFTQLSAQTTAAFISLNLDDDKAVLVDLYGLENQIGRQQMQDRSILLVERQAEYGPHFLSNLGLSQDGRFYRHSHVIAESTGQADFELFLALPSQLVILQKQQSISVYRLSDELKPLVPIPLQVMMADGTWSKPSQQQPLRHYYNNEQMQRVHFDETLARLSLAESYWGLRQFHLASEAFRSH
ncbi:MAG: beta-propeller domain-containing protein [Oligoflexus sp.]